MCDVSASILTHLGNNLQRDNKCQFLDLVTFVDFCFVLSLCFN